jgi:hypothetical protein
MAVNGLEQKRDGHSLSRAYLAFRLNTMCAPSFLVLGSYLNQIPFSAHLFFDGAVVWSREGRWMRAHNNSDAQDGHNG